MVDQFISGRKYTIDILSKLSEYSEEMLKFGSGYQKSTLSARGMNIVLIPIINSNMKKILIVEDEADMCLLLNILLTGKDIQLDHVKSISSATTYLESENPSVIILDNKLPDGFGLDFIPEMKKKYPNIKIIMISGFAGAVKDLAIENGADIFLNKPFTKDQLYKSVKELLN